MVNPVSTKVYVNQVPHLMPGMTVDGKFVLAEKKRLNDPSSPAVRSFLKFSLCHYFWPSPKCKNLEQYSYWHQHRMVWHQWQGSPPGMVPGQVHAGRGKEVRQPSQKVTCSNLNFSSKFNPDLVLSFKRY